MRGWLRGFTAVPSGFVGYGYELDVQNNSGTPFGSSFPSLPGIYGLNISALGSFTALGHTFPATINGAILVIGSTYDSSYGYKGNFNFGLIFSSYTVSNSAILDYSSAITSYTIGGVHTAGVAFENTFQGNSTYGVDTSGVSFGASAIRFGNNSSSSNQIITGKNTFGSDAPLLSIDGSNNLLLAGAGVNSISIRTSVLPSATASYNLGSLSLAFATAYAGSFYVTSSPSLKTDVADLPDMLPVVMNINPKSFRWKAGGFDLVSVEREIELPVFNEVTENKVHVEVRDRTPRMEKKVVVQQEQVVREGHEIQFGFMAPDFKDEFDKVGIKFGGYAADGSGGEGLAPHQQIAILWKAVQELNVIVEDLKKRIS